MSEEKEGVGATPDAGEATPSGADTAGVALALSGASREDAGAFLKDQRDLIADQRKMLHLQMEELREENPLKLSHLRIRRFGDYAKMALEISVGLLMLMLVAGISLMVWKAAHSEEVIIESFSVPPDMAARGITGQVVASQLLDKLTLMQNETITSRPGQAYAGGWGDDIKVEIPDTGVSVGEAYRFLKNWLGHDTRIGGEVIRTATGIAITARSGSDGGASFAGSENDLDALVQKAAEHVYRGTQPYRYGAYLGSHDRIAESLVVFKALAASGPPQERAWGYIGWNRQTIGSAAPAFRLWLLQRALALDPDNSTPVGNSAALELALGQEEEALSDLRKTVSMAGGDQMDATMRNTVKVLTQARIGSLFGDYREEASVTARIMVFGGAPPFLLLPPPGGGGGEGGGGGGGGGRARGVQGGPPPGGWGAAPPPARAYWFARAVQDAPSIPFAYADWGQALLERGKPDAAIAQVHARQPERPALRRSAGRLGRGADGEEPVAPGAGEVRGSREIRAQLGPPAPEMGRGAGLCGQEG